MSAGLAGELLATGLRHKVTLADAMASRAEPAPTVAKGSRAQPSGCRILASSDPVVGNVRVPSLWWVQTSLDAVAFALVPGSPACCMTTEILALVATFACPVRQPAAGRSTAAR